LIEIEDNKNLEKNFSEYTKNYLEKNKNFLEENSEE
jgi:hypothetical protein